MENPNCRLCDLWQSADERSVCLKGGGSRDAKLVIYLDAPSIVEDRRHLPLVSEAADFLRFLLLRMSIMPSQVYVDYVLKCYPKNNKNIGKKAFRAEMIEACSTYRVATLQSIRPKALIAMGTIACEAFTGSSEIKGYVGTSWTCNEPRIREIVEKVWVSYSPAYPLEAPAESVPIYRTLFAAAEEAGLQPKLNKKTPLFDYGF